MGLGSGLPGLVLTSLRVLLISVPLAWTLTRVFHFGIETVWLSFAASGLITSFVVTGVDAPASADGGEEGEEET